MKPDTLLVVVWWLWLGPALMVLLLPVRWGFALLIRGGESVSSSGIGGDGFAILGAAAVPFILGILPFVLLSLLYGFLFWRHRERSIALSARFWVPIYGSIFIVLILGIMAFVTLSREQREYWVPPPSGFSSTGRSPHSEPRVHVFCSAWRGGARR